MQRELNKDKKEERINFKVLKKKTKRVKNTGVIRKKKKKHYYDFNHLVYNYPTLLLIYDISMVTAFNKLLK